MGMEYMNPLVSSPCDRSFASLREELECDETRARLAAINELSRLVCQAKSSQHAVGTFLRDGSMGKKLLEVVMADLQATDRTLRCAAARLICQLAFENLVNQESILQLARHGFSLGWLYVFSVPLVYQNAYKTQCNARNESSTRTLQAFVQELMAEAYADVYTQVSAYYATACESFLPLCWHFPRTTSNTLEGTPSQEIPDPADHVLGFYLVPRQTQFPEVDDCYYDDVLHCLDEQDLLRLQIVKQACGECANESENGDLTTTAFLHYCSSRETKGGQSFDWLLSNAEPPIVASLGHYHNDSPSNLSWNKVFVYASMRLSSEKLSQTFGRDTLVTVASMFHELAFTSGERITASTNVWLPVLVAAIQHRSDLPLRFKKHIQNLQRGGVGLQFPKEPWRVLMTTKLDQVIPVSWVVFLTQWRGALELEMQLEVQSKADPLAPVRRTSVCSVGDIRKSIVSQMQLRSHRDLSGVVSPSQQDISTSAGRFALFRAQVQETDRTTEDDPLTRNLALFHRMQRSLTELDALGMKTLEEKYTAKQRLYETIAANKQRAVDAANQKRLQVNEKYREHEESLAELARRKAIVRSKLHEQQQLKHTQVVQRKQQQDADLEAKQQELAQQIQARDDECQENLRRRRQEWEEDRREQHQHRTIRSSRTIRTPTTPRPPSHERPLSARGKPTKEIPSPERLRQRALVYGHVVSKIYVTEAATRAAEASPAVLHQPHQLTRSFSVFHNSSFNVKAPVIKITPPPRRPRSPRFRRFKEPIDPPETEPNDFHEEEEGVGLSPSRRGRQQSRAKKDPTISTLEANACATLVMRNAALAVADRILIPDVPAPHVEDPSVPPYVIVAQYEALDEHHKRNFRERFNLKCVSHRLSYDVLKQYTKIVRRDMAWQVFHDRSGVGERIKYMDFVAVAQLLGIAMSEKRLLVMARQLDPQKTGYVEWKAFYTWWSLQYADVTVPPTRPKTVR